VPPARRGVTLLETVLGVVLLGMVAATLASTAGAMQRQAERDRQRLGAAELANRLLLQQIDDEENLPSQLLPVAYDGLFYRWRLDVRRCGLELSRAGQEDARANAGNGFDIRKRLRVATVTVWLAEESGGSTTDTTAVPRAVLARVFDPIAFRNADSTERKYGDDIGRMMEELFTLTEGAPEEEQQQESDR
jgi:type II secretory pathway pseudopilin PulG